MADNQVSNDIQWTKIQNAIRGRDKQGPAADQASKLLAANSLVRENGKGTYSAQDIRSLANQIDAENNLGADNGYMPGDFLNGIYSGFGGAIDDFWDRTVGKIAPTAADWFTGEDVGSALDIASDIGLSLIPGAGIPLVIGKNLLQNTRNFSDAIRGYNSTTGQYMTPDQQAMKLFGTAGTVAMSALPFGLGKIGKAGKAGAEAAAKESSRLGKLAEDLKISKEKNPLPDEAIAEMAPVPKGGKFTLSEEQLAKGNGLLSDDAISAIRSPLPKNLSGYSSYPVSASTEVVPLDKSFLKKVSGKFKAEGEAKKEFKAARDSVPQYEKSLNEAKKELKALKGAEAAEADAAELAAKEAEIAGLEEQLAEAKAIEAFGSKRRYKKATTGSRGARDNILSGFGGKRTSRMNTAIDNLGYRKDMTSLEYLDDLVKNDVKTAISLYNTTGNAATKNLLKTVFDSNFEKGAMDAASKVMKSGASVAKADRTFKEVLQGLPGGSEGKLPDWRYGSDRGINAAILGSGLATQAASMYGNGADPFTAFIDNPDRVIANIIASAAFRKPTVKTIASRTPRFYNTAQRSATNAQRMNYLNRLAQDQYGLDQELTDDQIADLISGQAYQDQYNRTLTDDLLRQVYGYAGR